MELDDCETSLVETVSGGKPCETTIRPITVYQAHQSERLVSNELEEFMLDGVKFTKVLLITHAILSSDTSDSKGVYDLEDGTGSIRGSLPMNAFGAQDLVTFSTIVQKFHGGLARVTGKLVQFGHKKSINIESIVVAGYHQAILKKSPVSDTGETVMTSELVEEVPHDDDSTRVDSGTPNQPYHSFCGLTENDQGGEVSPVETDGPSLRTQSDANRGESSSFKLPVWVPSRLPTPPPAVEPDTTPSYSVISQAASPRTITRTPSPVSSLGSSLRINPHFVPQYGHLTQLKATQLAIVSSLCQPEDDSPYGFWISDVFANVTQATETTREEFINDVEWLLEEAYIVRPLDDDRIALTPRASV